MNNPPTDNSADHQKKTRRNPYVKIFRILVIVLVIFFLGAYLTLQYSVYNEKKREELVSLIKSKGGSVGFHGAYRYGLHKYININYLSRLGFTRITYSKASNVLIKSSELDDNFLSELGYFRSLDDLILMDHRITDLTPIRNHPNLKILNLSRDHLMDLGPIASLTKLEKLSLSDNQITDLKPLTHLKKLKYLNLKNNQVTDLSPLVGLVNLEELYLNGNQIQDITPLTGLLKLRYLEINNNQIKDVKPLGKLFALDSLQLNDNQIRDVSGLSNLTQIVALEFMDNQISDLTPLNNLHNLWGLYFNGNQITDLSPLTTLKGISKINIGDNPGLSEEEINRFKKARPKCNVIFDRNN